MTVKHPERSPDSSTHVVPTDAILARSERNVPLTTGPKCWQSGHVPDPQSLFDSRTLRVRSKPISGRPGFCLTGVVSNQASGQPKVFDSRTPDDSRQLNSSSTRHFTDRVAKAFDSRTPQNSLPAPLSLNKRKSDKLCQNNTRPHTELMKYILHELQHDHPRFSTRHDPAE